jgi:hypothetical protein
MECGPSQQMHPEAHDNSSFFISYPSEDEKRIHFQNAKMLVFM